MSMVRNMMKKLTETKWTGVVLAGAGILMMIFGIYRGEMSVVFTKADRKSTRLNSSHSV